MSTTELALWSDRLVLAALATLSACLLTYACAAAFTVRSHRRSAVAGSASATPASTTPASTTPETAGGDAPSAVAVIGITREGWVNPLRPAGTFLMGAGSTMLVCAVIARGLAAGRVPWGNMYEFGLTGAAAVGVTFLVVRRGRQIDAAAPWTVALVLLLLGVSVTSLYTPVDDLVPVLDSTWLVVHVAAAIVAGALFTVGALATLGQIIHTRTGRTSDRQGRDFGELAHTVHLVAFPIWTFAVIAGAVWAENAWGRYWGWDPKETWAFITWVLYAAHLHALATSGWQRRAGWLAVAGFAAFLFNFFGVNIWLPGLHSYAGV